MVKEMETSPDKSEIELFQCLADGLTKIQNKLDHSYQKKTFRRDHILKAACPPILQRAFTDKIPISPQESMQRIGSLLSPEHRSAGANCAFGKDENINY